MITQIDIENIRSYTKRVIDFSPQGNFIYGVNGCLAGSTLIDLPRNLKDAPLGIPIKELVGKSFYVYSYSADKRRIVLKKAFNVRKTGVKVPVFKIKYSSRTYGIKNIFNEIVLTADHLIMLKNSTYRRAIDLCPGDSLMPFYRSIPDGYAKINLNNGQKVYEHKFILNELSIFSEEGHHKDRNRLNNSINNLIGLSLKEHRGLHYNDVGQLDKMIKQVKTNHPGGMKGKFHCEEVKTQISSVMKNLFKDIPFRLNHKYLMEEDGKRRRKCKELDYDFLYKVYVVEKKSTIEIGNMFKVSSSCIRSKLINMGIQRRSLSAASLVKYNLIIPPASELYDLYIEKQISLKDMAINYGVVGKTVKSWLINYNIPLRSKRDALRIFRKNNHAVVSKEFLGYEDVYDMEVEDTHNFVANGIVVHNSGKSTLIELILFSFFGTIGLRTKKEEAIRDLTKPAEVTLRCNFPPLGLININRSLTSNKAELSSPSHHITSGPQITKFFTKLFVSSPQLFQHTFVAKQKEVDLLSRLDRSKRRDLLTELLGLDILDSMIQLITEDTKSIQLLPDLSELRVSVDQIESEVNGLDFNVLMRIQQLQTELKQSSDKDVKPKLDKFESIYYSLITLSESLKVKIDLYSLGLESISNSCPLCSTSLTQEQVEAFHLELTQLKTKLMETRHLLDKVVPVLNNLRTLSSRRPKNEILTELGPHKDMDISYFLSKLSTLEKKRGILSLYNDIDISAVKTKKELKELLSSFRLKCLHKFFSEIVVYVSSLLNQCSDFNKFEVDENLDIYVDGRSLISFSGGETDLICTALRICISKYMAYLRFGYIPLIILDSCFDSLDREKAQGVITALEHDPSLRQLIITGHRTLDLIPNTNVIYL